MAILLNDNIKTNAPKPTDSRYLNNQTVWSNISEVNSNIPKSERYQGLTVNINGDEYWYKDGIENSDLVLKQEGGSINPAGDDTEVQLNVYGELGASPNFSYNKDEGELLLRREISEDYDEYFRIGRFYLEEGYQVEEGISMVKRGFDYLDQPMQGYIGLGNGGYGRDEKMIVARIGLRNFDYFHTGVEVTSSFFGGDSSVAIFANNLSYTDMEEWTSATFYGNKDKIEITKNLPITGDNIALGAGALFFPDEERDIYGAGAILYDYGWTNFNGIVLEDDEELDAIEYIGYGRRLNGIGVYTGSFLSNNSLYNIIGSRRSSFFVKKSSSLGNLFEIKSDGTSIFEGKVRMGFDKAIEMGSYSVLRLTSGDFGRGGLFIGPGAGYNSTAQLTIAIGEDAANYSSSEQSVYIGIGSGNNNTGNTNIGIGNGTLGSSEGNENICIGDNAGYNTSSSYSTFVGKDAGASTSGSRLVAIGNNALANSTGLNAFAIGNMAGYGNTGQSVLAIGASAARFNSGNGCTSFGGGTNMNNSGDGVLTFGEGSGVDNEGDYCMFIGRQCGEENKGDSVMAIGQNLAYGNEGIGCMFIGEGLGEYNQARFLFQLGLKTVNPVPLIEGDFASGEVTIAGKFNAGQLSLTELNTAPSSSSDTGTEGEIKIDGNHVYVCVATDTWKRAELQNF